MKTEVMRDYNALLGGTSSAPPMHHGLATP
jgi:hypothetical protein